MSLCVPEPVRNARDERGARVTTVTCQALNESLTMLVSVTTDPPVGQPMRGAVVCPGGALCDGNSGMNRASSEV